MDVPNGPGQRKAFRDDFDVVVDFGTEDRFFTGFAGNISDGGLFIATERPLPVGLPIMVRFSIPQFEAPITVTAEVRWVRPSRPDLPETAGGMGVKFLDLPAEIVHAVDGFIRAHRSDTIFWG